jgi:Tol biopolymer transport system component
MSATTYAIRRAAALLIALFAIACADLPTEVPVDPNDPNDPTDPTTPITPTVAAVTLSLEQVTLDEGGSQTIIATPRDSSGTEIKGLATTWTNSDPSVAEVDAAGQITAVRTGSTIITAKVQGKTAPATVVVQASYAFDLLYSVRAFDIFREIYSLDVRNPGAVPSRLFAPNQWASQARPSPDGTRIAYICPDPTFGEGAICVAHRDGSNPTRVLAFIGEEFTQPTWSPDGTRLAYVRSRNDGVRNVSHIWVANADGSEATPLTEDVTGDQSMPAWSPALPDGTQRIAFVQDLNLNPRIWSMRTDGTDRRQLGSMSGANDIQPAWSPDGLTIAFQRTTASLSADIWLMNADGSSERPLLAAPLAGSQLAPAWSPDGRLVAFTSAHESSAGGSTVYQLYTVWADGTKLARRTFDASDKSAPAFLPVAR